MKCTPKVRQLTERVHFYMTKYNLEFKLKLITEIEASGRGPKYIAKKYGVAISPVRLWFKRYQLEGIDGLIAKPVDYSGEFKESVLEYMKQNHLSYNETALHFKIRSIATLLKWSNLVEKEGNSRLYEDKRGQHFKMNPKKKKIDKPVDPNSIEALREENEQLRMENAYLKKLNALVQQRQDQEAGKKSKS